MSVPIHVGVELRRMDNEEFKACAYEVMSHAFDVQKELGRLFHESIYQHELAYRVADARREVPIEVRFEEFCKTYYLDLLVGSGAVFELKAVDSLVDRHRRQLLQYLFLVDLPHGKLVNLRPERVQHEFVNNTLTRSDRTSFNIDTVAWNEPDGSHLKDSVIEVLRDWGTGLDVALYEEVAAHLCGQPADLRATAEIRYPQTLEFRPAKLIFSPMKLFSALRITYLFSWMELV